MKSINKLLAVAVMAASAPLTVMTASAEDFNYVADHFADIEVLRYQVPDFDNLSLRQKKLVYYLTEAALSGRDILFDQNCKYNLKIRQTLEAIYRNYRGAADDKDFQAFATYLKQVWFANGIHHHYSTDKFTPAFSREFFEKQVRAIPAAKLPLCDGQTAEGLIAELVPVITTR